MRFGPCQGSDTSVYLRQYKADGTVFWNHVFVAALRNSEDKIINYVGIQHPLDKVSVLMISSPWYFASEMSSVQRMRRILWLRRSRTAVFSFLRW